MLFTALAGNPAFTDLTVLDRSPGDQEEIVITHSPGLPPRASLRRVEGGDQMVPMIPVGMPILPMTEVRSFGVEHRCQHEQAGLGIVMRCVAGGRPAGFGLHVPSRRLPAGAHLAMHLEVAGEPAGFSAQMVRKGADALAPIPLTAGMNVFPIHAEVSELVLVAPMGEAHLKLAGLALEPHGALQNGGVTRAAWAWEPERWRDDPAGLIAQAAERGIGTLYVGLEIDSERQTVRNPEKLADFVVSARRHGIVVVAVEGDPGMIAGDGLRHALHRASAIAKYQKHRSQTERLAGVQYDIEPYVAKGWRGDEADYAAWGGAVVALAEASGTRLDLVIPFWLPQQASGRALLDHARGHLGRVTVMAYRTTAENLMAAAEPGLNWGSVHGLPVTVALEAGVLADETDEIYAAAHTGTLAVFPGEPARIAMLASPGQVTGARMYRLARREEIPARRISFQGDETRMVRLAANLSSKLAAWPSFSGFAFHGLPWR